MKVGSAILYKDGELVISKNHTYTLLNILKRKIIKDYGEFEDTDVPWKNESSKIKKVRILDQVKANCMKAWFKDCLNLTTLIDFQNLDVSDCIDFSCMFYNCYSLQNLNELLTWNVSNGADFSYMFYNCKSLQGLNGLQNWSISNGTNFNSMFAHCESLQKILLSNTLDILTKEMFYNCNPNLKIHWRKHIYTYSDLLEYQTIY